MHNRSYNYRRYRYTDISVTITNNVRKTYSLAKAIKVNSEYNILQYTFIHTITIQRYRDSS